MATSIKRVIIMLVMIDILFGMALYYTHGAGSDANSEFENSIQGYTNWSNDFSENYPDTVLDTQTIQMDKQFGDPKFGQKKIYEVLTKQIEGIQEDECYGEDCSKTYIDTLSKYIWYLWGLIHLLAGLEVVYLVYSKKYD